MLNFMRQNANSWVMILFFGIIIFVFAIQFGPAMGKIAPAIPYAAIVNHETISLAEFRTAYSSQFARIKQFRPEYDQAQADRDGLKQMVIEQLVSRELLYQLGKKYNLTVGAKTLADELKERVFGQESDFNKDEYVRRVNAYFQSTVQQFEEQVAKEIVAGQVVELLGSSISVSEQEVLNAYIDKSTKVAIEFVKISPDYFSTSNKSESELAEFAKNNAPKISDYYNEHIGQYVKEEEIKASHILIKLPPKASAEEENLKKEKANKILARLKNNEDFARLAQEESEDDVTKLKGGDLDFFAKGMMVEEFSQAAFKLKPGEVSDVVKSPLGFHIIKATEHRPKTERKLADVSAEIANNLLKTEEQEQKAKSLAAQALSQLQAGLPLAQIKVPQASNGDEKADKNAPVKDETEAFSRSSSFVYKLGRMEDLSDAAFKLTLDKRTASEVVKANGNFFAIRLKSREDADMANFDKEKEALAASLLYPRKRALMQQYLTQLKASAKISYNDTLAHAPTADL